MASSRRIFLAGAGALGLAAGTTLLRSADGLAQSRDRGRPASPAGNLGLDAATLGLNANSPDDQTRALTAAVREAAQRQVPLVLQPGRYHVSAVPLVEGSTIIGVGGQARLVQAADAPIMLADGIRRGSLLNLMFDGMGQPLPQGRGLVEINGTPQFIVEACSFTNSAQIGLVLRGSGGRVDTTSFTGMGSSALFSLDATGLSAVDNTIRTCSNNGIQIWRSAAGEDSTIVRGNRISDIHFDAGGTGENGNGISVFRAGGVVIANNVVRDCALSAIRNNSGANCQILGNNCAHFGETAIFSEFAFEGAVIANNIIDDAATGISITNLDQGGRLAVCSGNLVRNVTRRKSPYAPDIVGGYGIHAEAETTVTGNAIDGADFVGISAGWSYAMRNLVITSNMVRGSPVGIGVSLVPDIRNAVIANNVIAGAAKGAIIGYRYTDAVTGDLTRGADERAKGIRIEGNAVTS
ncbi:MULTISPECIES: TIGR03808 family TAT-translocated repetitive protein [unclassified Chelatococcus]|uniref:TIGR03808 family TAT-translocated repetitive protein n=1 Tax=unclassified Chelatococcus TaxID=2638111 RepID=UPI001BCE66CF|nr:MULTISPECIES: TIGR03808 family TAT-translocated repetitive protein [unclassified Chelatococcus]MBS7698426.1 TIGR03808 family TAT-translocated repetitive protein [Chelatococcus sp. YT9]MBX3559496.1 TIGR03808 family TAT-translocated repetitive protein [Chelatococcus sp.]